jgi:hypothetical protein
MPTRRFRGNAGKRAQQDVEALLPVQATDRDDLLRP